MTLSFIIPVYNVASYLRKCVDSLLAQDYTDYEIILVDDGSTDNCGAICDEYASKLPITNHQSPIIRVIHQPNGGLSAARNSGLKVAKGAYVCFVDSDDYWQTNVLGGLMAQVQREQLDVLRFDYQNVRLNPQNEYEVFEPNKQPRRIDRCAAIVSGEEYLNTRMGYACYAVQFIIKRSVLLITHEQPINNHQSPITTEVFTQGIHFEDTEWLPRMMLPAKRVNSTTTVVYNYLLRVGSITKTQGNKAKIRKNLEDSMFIIARYQTYREQYPSCHWLHNMQSSMAVGVLTMVAREFYSERRVYLQKLRGLDVFPLALSNQGKTYLRRARLVNLSPRLAMWLFHLKK